MRLSRRVSPACGVALVIAIALGGCVSVSDHLVSERWGSACRALERESTGRTIGWMWARGALRFRGGAWTAEDVARELGVVPYEYGTRAVIVELEVELDDGEAHALVGQSRDTPVAASLQEVRELADRTVGARAPPPPKPRLPPGPHVDAPAARPDFLSSFVAPLLSAMMDAVLLPAELALLLPSGGEVHPFMLFERFGDAPTAVDMFDDALLTDDEWTALAKERAVAYVAAVTRFKRERSQREHAVELFQSRVLASRRCKAIASDDSGEPTRLACKPLGIVSRDAAGAAWLVVDVDAEFGGGESCFALRRFVARFPDGDLVSGAQTAMASLQPEAR